MQTNLIKAYLNNWLSEDENTSLISGFSTLNLWLVERHATYTPKIQPAFYGLYHYAMSNENRRALVMELITKLEGNHAFETTDDTLNFVLDQIYDELVASRVNELLFKINAKESLTHSTEPTAFVSSTEDTRLSALYDNHSDKLNIDFAVQKLPFPLEVLDPRIVTIPAGKVNELHKHAHETVFIFLSGTGHVTVDKVTIPVQSGDFVFIPRWCLHQSVNTGTTEMKFLAVADFGLTGKAFVGNYLKTARLKEQEA
jgi:oxalate decarboxylase/phosphoglucose isomerase-like protein (cupin superfamily)